MTSHVISHQAPRRKRGRAWGKALRRFGAFIIAVMTLTLVAWLAQRAPAVNNAAPAAPPRADVVLPAAAPLVPETDQSAAAPAPRPRSIRRVRADSVAPTASVHSQPGGFEVLSAAELDGISQARH